MLYAMLRDARSCKTLQDLVNDNISNFPQSMPTFLYDWSPSPSARCMIKGARSRLVDTREEEEESRGCVARGGEYTCQVPRPTFKSVGEPDLEYTY